MVTALELERSESGYVAPETFGVWGGGDVSGRSMGLLINIILLIETFQFAVKLEGCYRDEVNSVHWRNFC